MSLVAYGDSSDESEEEIKSVKKQKESVKIRIPSLKEFEDEEDERPLSKKPKFTSGSGLFSILPPPKNSSTLSKPGFIPHIFSLKKEKTIADPSESNKTAASSVAVSSTNQSTSSALIPDEQESDDEGVCTKDDTDVASKSDFFWLDDLATKNQVKKKEHELFSGAFKTNSSVQDVTKLPSVQSYVTPGIYPDEKVETYPHQQESMENASEDVSSGYGFSEEQQSHDNSMNESISDPTTTLFHNKEFLKLGGRKREFEDMNIIDVNADDQLTNKNEWLMKSITEENTYRPKKKHGNPTQQQKRKHQITYLAFQAKEREADLKNQWALNNRTRRETQAKYGF